MLNDDEQYALLKQFPNVELSYETNVHNKVQNADYVLAIPEGKKYFAWFTVFKNQNVCVLMEIGKNKKIVGLRTVYCCFKDSLSYGTIFYGTLFSLDARFFSIENVLYYKGNHCSASSFKDKLDILEIVFSREIKQHRVTNSSIVFGLPIISATYDDLMKKTVDLPYLIKYVQFRENRKNRANDCLNLDISKTRQVCEIDSTLTISREKYENIKPKMRDNKQRIVFHIKPDIQNDIYHLHLNDNGELNYYNVAYIPDFKTSVMMNRLFRNIKENENLDALEESDDEEEFENDKEDKFVYLDRAYNMVCEYNYKFRKWTPIREALSSEKITNKSELVRLEKNKY